MGTPAKGALRGWALNRTALAHGLPSTASLLPGGAAPALTAPVNLVAPSISGSTVQGSTLTASSGSWSGNPIPNYSYEWFRDGVSTGQTSTTYNLTLADVDAIITVTVTATNSQGSASSTSAGVGPVTSAPPPPVAPSFSVQPSISGTTVQGDTLTGADGTYSGTPAPTVIARRWRSDGLAVGTGPTYVLEASDVGRMITFEVVVENSAGTATGTSTAVGPVTTTPPPSADMAAPTLDYPTASNPPELGIHLPEDWQTGDVLKIKIATNLAFTTGVQTLTHTLTDADAAPGATITMGLPTLSGVNYIEAYGARGGLDSTSVSNIVAWGDSTAPSFTSAASSTLTETLQVNIAPTFDAPIANLALTGPDQLQFETYLSGGSWHVRGAGSKTFLMSDPKDQNLDNVYQFTLVATDYAGNTATQDYSLTMTAADLAPDAFTFNNVSNAPLNTVETSNTVTMSGLEPGFDISASVSGSGFTYSKNGGAYAAPGSFTVQNGDTLTLRGTSGSTNSSSVVATVTVGSYTTTWSIATPGSAATLTIGTGATGAGTARSKYINVASPGFQMIHNNNDGAYAFVRATLPAANTKWHAETTLNSNWPTSGQGFNLFGISDASYDDNVGGVGSSFSGPGDGTNAGFFLKAEIGFNQIEWHANGTNGNFNLGVAMAAGDVIIVEGDESTGDYDVFFYDASAGALVNGGAPVGSMTLTTPPASTYLVAGGTKGDGTVAGSDAQTVNFGASTWVMTPTTGYDYYA